MAMAMQDAQGAPSREVGGGLLTRRTRLTRTTLRNFGGARKP